MKDYYCDFVGISQNHMVVISREKEIGKKIALSCGSNNDKATCIESIQDFIKILQEIKLFIDNRPDEEPIKASVSRY